MLESSNKFSHNQHINTVDLGTRETATGGIPRTSEVVDPKKPNIIRRLAIAGISTLAGAAVVVGTVMAVESNNHNGPIKDQPVATGEATPGNSEKPSPSATPETDPTEQLIASHEIKAGQAPEALSQNVLSELSAWEVAGSDTITQDLLAEVKKTGDGSDEAVSAFLDKYTAKQAAIFGPALFGPDYASNPDVKNIIAINKATLHNVFASNKDQDPYSRSLAFNSVVMSSDTSVSIAFTEKDNAGQNNKITDSVNGETGTLSVIYETQGDNIFFKSIQFTN